MVNINISDIAKKAGVSPATVSRVMNWPDSVKNETRQKVLKVIEQSNYTPNPAARNLSTNTTPNNIALFIPDVANPFFIDMLKGITTAADKLDYNVFLFDTDESSEREHRFIQTVINQKIKGVIMIPVSEHDKVTENGLIDLDKQGIPVVLLDRKIGTYSFDGVFTNDMVDSFKAVEILIKEGHKKIAIISGTDKSGSGQERLLGYKQALENYNIPYNPKYVEYGDFKFQKGYESAKRLLELQEPPTAIFSANNFSTLGAIQCFFEKELVVGRDISIIGFDEIKSWLYINPIQAATSQISVIERPIKQMAVEAVSLLQRNITEGSFMSRARRKVVLENRIVLNGSECLSKKN